MIGRAVAFLLALVFVAAPAGSDAAAPKARADAPIVSHGLSIYGDLKYPPNFTHFNYVNPDAPKGGDVKLSAVGTFDSLNPYILKGVPAAGLNLTFQTLLANADDEASAAYGLIAESVETPPDRSWVIFTLRPEARFHDGSPITPDDVVFSFDTLRAKGHPFFRAYYASVKSVEKIGERQAKFTFAPGNNRELPFIIGNGLPILSKAFFEKNQFDKTTLQPILGSGPYRVESVVPGRSITYSRVPDYWAAELPTERGQYNFDTIRYDYYRDSTVDLEAFKAGEYDFRAENTAKVWATGYDFPALRAGLVKKEEIPNEQPTGMQAFVFNTRRPIFQDRNVREALGYAFDFEWTNAHLFYGAYTRTGSYFSNSELASRGLPSPGEREILDRYRGKIPDEVFTKEYDPPSTDQPGGIRANLIEAQELLKRAGWVVRDNRLVNDKTGEPFAFEILLVNPAFERIAAPFADNLRRLGIDARIRTVDTSQYQNRADQFDFDMIVDGFGQSLSPGNEQRDFWTSKAAETPGSRNTIGIHDPVVDALVELVIGAPNRQALTDRTRALDRALLWNFYVIPHWHVRVYRVAYWDKFVHPEVTPKYALGFTTWWIDSNKAAEIASTKARVVASSGEGASAGTHRAWLIFLAAASVLLLFWVARGTRPSVRE
ncbi:MAG TPA: extracellular solute-binding protein [Alphaproteobacteria bacterium]|nr:extracellular solute-binding protein [Alphaproteobacteria bacterium]